MPTDDIETTGRPQGIDCSNHQHTIDWGKVAAAGKSFAFVKASQGVYFTDPYFARNRAMAKTAGLLMGAYHYYDPHYDPVAQAKYFCKVVGSIPIGELQPVLDLESLGNQNGLKGSVVPKDKVIHDAVVWLTEVQNRTGRQAIIYSYVSFIENELGNTHRFCKDFPLWIAHYGVMQPTVPGGWATWSFWQFDDKGRCPGIVGDCDMDTFNGSLAQLRKFAGL